MVRDLGIKMLPTADNACVGSSLRHLNVIGVGLSKTGTTAAALALSRAGLKVAHNLNDLLSDHCEAIFNTLEANYELLDRKHPRARWLVTHSGDSRKWLASVQQHQQQSWKAHRHLHLAFRASSVSAPGRGRHPADAVCVPLCSALKRKVK